MSYGWWLAFIIKISIAKRLMMKKTSNPSNRRAGFTIVELLIVIVVIAILAAISIVAYSGITSRARDTENRSDATTLLKVTEAISADLGAYPQGTSTATLKTSYAASPTVKIPASIDIVYATAAPANGTAITNADNSNQYTVWPCAAGANIYYPSRALGTIQVLKAGAGCP